MSYSTSTIGQQSGKILVVDDHAQARMSMTEILKHVGHQVSSCSNAPEALELLKTEQFDVILTDLMMPGMSGLEFIRELERRKEEAEIVMITAHASVETAVDAMRHGAYDYIEKPFGIEQIEDLVSRALQQGTTSGKRAQTLGNEIDGIVMLGESEPMRKLREQIRKASATDVTILINGESGTGKELVAKSIHALSPRCQGPMVSLNCPALSPQLMESELFGHEKGAFTNADTPRVGRFELASGGTIFLDEVTEIEMGLQSKLLRVLQERCFERVGSSETRQVDVRVVAATNRDLQSEVASGRFRQDLYYRLAVVPIHVPPLRNRRSDVPQLANHFLSQVGTRIGTEHTSLSDSAIELLQEYHWPGNVRELENLMTRVCVLSENGKIEADDIRPCLMTDSNSGFNCEANVVESSSSNPDANTVIQPGTSLQEMERALIEATLERFDGHREKTAKALGIGVRTLSSRLRSFGYAPREKSFGNRSFSKSA